MKDAENMGPPDTAEQDNEQLVTESPQQPIIEHSVTSLNRSQNGVSGAAPVNQTMLSTISSNQQKQSTTQGLSWIKKLPRIDSPSAKAKHSTTMEAQSNMSA